MSQQWKVPPIVQTAGVVLLLAACMVFVGKAWGGEERVGWEDMKYHSGMIYPCPKGFMTYWIFDHYENIKAILEGKE